MKPLALHGIVVLPLFGILQAATYSTSFDSFTPGEVAGQDGWAINSPTPNLSFIANWNGTYAAALGGQFDIPDTATVGLTHAYAAALGSSSFSFDFTVRDSTNTFPNRDAFGFALRNGTGNLFAVHFTPSTQTATPDNEPAQWNLSYTVGVDPSISLTQGVLEGGTYSFSLAFTPNGASTDFDLAVTGSNTENRNGTFALDPTTMSSDLGLLWNANGGDPNNVGDNFFLMDNLVAIPEPSSALLLGLASLGFVTRRKRE